jgi:hypothetical protein
MLARAGIPGAGARPIVERKHDGPRRFLGNFQSVRAVEGSGKGTLETEDPALDTRGALAVLRSLPPFRRRAELVSALSLDGNRAADVNASPLDEARLSSRLRSCPGPECETRSRLPGARLGL